MTTPNSDETLFDLAGGEPAIRAVVEHFYEAVFRDVMIGFFFRNADKTRLVEKEIELASRMLGADVRYTGKPMRKAHAAHRIMGGQFERRLQLLRESMEAKNLPQVVRDAWVQHTENLRPQITEQQGSDCD
jgi:hemoglobin